MVDAQVPLAKYADVPPELAEIPDIAESALAAESKRIVQREEELAMGEDRLVHHFWAAAGGSGTRRTCSRRCGRQCAHDRPTGFSNQSSASGDGAWALSGRCTNSSRAFSAHDPSAKTEERRTCPETSARRVLLSAGQIFGWRRSCVSWKRLGCVPCRKDPRRR